MTSWPSHLPFYLSFYQAHKLGRRISLSDTFPISVSFCLSHSLFVYRTHWHSLSHLHSQQKTHNQVHNNTHSQTHVHTHNMLLLQFSHTLTIFSPLSTFLSILTAFEMFNYTLPTIFPSIELPSWCKSTSWSNKIAIKSVIWLNLTSFVISLQIFSYGTIFDWSKMVKFKKYTLTCSHLTRAHTHPLTRTH